MSAVKKVLVIGGGIAGTTVAALLAEGGVDVELVEKHSEVDALGSGITLQGNALRVFKTLGVLDECLAAGCAFGELALREPGPGAEVIAVLENQRVGGPDLPSTLGMYRPDLAHILVERAAETGVRLTYGTTVVALEQDEAGVDVTFHDGREARYDVVIGADGIRSATRTMIGIDIQATSGGVGIWRIFAKRPVEVVRSELFYGGSECFYSGYTPTSETTLYAHLNEPAQDRSRLSAEEKAAIVLELSRAYSGPWDEIRADISASSRIHYAWAESHLLVGPWNRGRTVLIGDAAHSCPPTVAQGAAMSLEDAAVLAEILLAHDNLSDAMWQEFTDRRQPRVKEVVDTSNQILEWTLQRDQSRIPDAMARVAKLVGQPA